MRIPKVAVAAVSIVLSLHKLDRYDSHWWWDNLSHCCAGFAIGCVLDDVTNDGESTLTGFLAITTMWEIYEHRCGIRPWDGSMTFDHAVEDTILDTVMGLLGAYVATKIRAS